MELVAVLRMLWERRLVVAVGAVLAIAAAVIVGRSVSPAVTGGVASARVLFDTADSQLVKAAPKEAETTPMRAFLIAELVGGDHGRAIVAREAGVPEGELSVIGPSEMLEPPVETPLAEQIAAGTAQPGTPYVLRVYTDAISPIIAIEATAPDGRRAEALVDAAVDGVSALVVEQDSSGSRGFVTEVVARAIVPETVSRPHRGAVAVVTAVAVFALWCAAVTVLQGIARRARRSRVVAQRA